MRAALARSAAGLACALLAAGPTTLARAQSSCIECHATRSEARLRAPLEASDGDAHDAAGVSCHDCHGGDPAETSVRAHSLVLGFVGVPSPLGAMRLCGRCHDGSREGTPDVQIDHRAGAHGRAIAMGREAAATCTSCHGAHGIVPVEHADAPTGPAHVVVLCEGCHSSADRLGGADLELDVALEYRESVHGRAAALGNPDAPTCVSCHGPHDNAAGLRATLACGECHASVRAAFDEGPHATAFGRLGFVDCAECHGSHAIRAPDATLLAGLGSACGRCHGPEQEVTARVEAITALGGRLDVLRTTRERDDPAREAAMLALHRLDGDALALALADVEEAAPATAAPEAPAPTTRPLPSWRLLVIALALGVATTALLAWMRARRAR